VAPAAGDIDEERICTAAGTLLSSNSMSPNIDRVSAGFHVA
jgi:hypothetical protein